MTLLQKIEKAYEFMRACNNAYELEIFMDVKLSIDDENIEFDILASNIEHAVQICGLLNLTLNFQANTDPESDKIINFYII